MKKIFGEIVSIALVFIMSFSFIGCKDTETGGDDNPPPPSWENYLPPLSEELDTTTCNVFVSAQAGENGDGSEKSPFRTLEEARDYVRGIRASEERNIRVYVRGGYYYLEDTFELTEQDGAPEGKKTYYMNYPGEKPVISGGRKITDWRFVNNLYQAQLEPGLNIRNFFVNGERKIRARSKGASGVSMDKAESKYKIISQSELSNIASWGNPKEIELVSSYSWKMFRLGVTSVTNTEIVPDSAQYIAGTATGALGLTDLRWIENAKELLDEEEEWYYDKTTGKIYYKPRADEKLRSSEAIVPLTEGLVKVHGTLENPVQNLVFRGLTFAYDAWNEVDAMGYIEHQAGVIQSGPGWFDMYKTPGSVEVSAARNVTVERNTFKGLGINALSVVYGSKDVTVDSNYFVDNSAAAVSVADIQGTDPREPDVPGVHYDHHPSDERRIVERVTVSNNVITKCGAEYYSNPGIFVGYARNISVLNNSLYDLPYSAISMGWGWGYPDVSATSVCKNNVIKGNRIIDFMKVMHDGGGIYTLGAQPGSEISENYVVAQENDYSYIYLDNGSAGFTVKNNVVSNEIDGIYGHCANWILISTFMEPAVLHAHDVNLTDNWYTYGLSAFRSDAWGSDIVRENNKQIENYEWPAEAKAVMDRSGSTVARP